MYSIKPLLLSTVPTNRSLMTYLLYHNKTDVLPMVSWYINANGTNVLIDTGISVAEHKKFANIPMDDVQSFDQALGTVSLTADDIDLIILTHLHYDHCANAQRCKNARVVVQKKELEFANSNHPVFGRYYASEYFKDLNFELVDGEKEILPGIRVIPMFGHTPGCQAVAIKTAAGIAAISGACTIKENFYPPEKLAKVWPVLIPAFHIDVTQSYYDLLKLKDMADILIPQHDIGFASMKEIPQAD